jgi:hypothetical protein
VIEEDTLKYFKLAVMGTFLLSTLNCYTKFAQFETLPSEQVVTVLDSKGNLVREVRQNDTLRTPNGETCVWEQDALGYPYLHCYPRYYPQEWYRYNKSPWWYRTDEHLYNIERCPAYYYFDEHCECCRYYLNNPDLSKEESRDGTARVSAETPAPVTSTRASTTNINVTNSTGFRQAIVPGTPFQNPGSTTTVNANKSAAPVPQQNSGTAAAVSDSSKAGKPVDSSKAGSASAAAQPPSTPAGDSGTVPVLPERARRTMRSR